MNELLILLPFGALFLMGVVCDLDDVLDNSACIDRLAENEKLAAEINYMMQELTACGGTEFTIDTLAAAAACLESVSEARLKSIAAYNAYLGATAAGGSPSLAMDTIQTNIKCLKLRSPHQLLAFKTLLACQLRECVAA
jgi:hypothetical protein